MIRQCRECGRLYQGDVCDHSPIATHHASPRFIITLSRFHGSAQIGHSQTFADMDAALDEARKWTAGGARNSAIIDAVVVERIRIFPNGTVEKSGNDAP